MLILDNVVDHQDVWVPQVSLRVGLVFEACSQLARAKVLSMKQLYRALNTQTGVCGEEHRTHSTSAEHPLDDVASAV
jgi:hypothetical protein